jgi:hypothetical protein
MKDIITTTVYAVNNTDVENEETLAEFIERMFPDPGAPTSSAVLSFESSTGSKVRCSFSKTGIRVTINGEAA